MSRRLRAQSTVVTQKGVPSVASRSLLHDEEIVLNEINAREHPRPARTGLV